MTTSTLRLGCVWLDRVTVVFFAASFLTLASPTRAAQETFWPFNLFPPPTWNFDYTNDSVISASIPSVGTIMSRRLVLSGFANPIVLPGSGDSVVYNNVTTTLDSESSLDGGANWAPYTGSGNMTLTIRQTNNAPGVRQFEIELSSQNVPVNGAYGAATVRESPSRASLGALVVTATNGGLLYSGFINFNLEISVDSGANWFAASPSAYIELLGPPGTPATLSIAKTDTTVTLCWPTETIGQYQLQQVGALDGTNWSNVGSIESGTGGEVCVNDAFSAGTNKFYRLLLSP